MIEFETDSPPENRHFDIAIVALGYEKRCTWVWRHAGCEADYCLALDFGFLEGGSYKTNRKFFEGKGFKKNRGVGEGALLAIIQMIASQLVDKDHVRVFIDISSMSREMMANAVVAVNSAACGQRLSISVAYAPSEFISSADESPIKIARPITRALSGWSAQPEKPLGAVFGLGAEPGLALGALQFLEPGKTWIFVPQGLDKRFDDAVAESNGHIEDIFDVTRFGYRISSPSVMRGKYEALIKSVSPDYRIVSVPFGPKIFAWACIATSVFAMNPEIGVWVFSSYDHGVVQDRDAHGDIIWHSLDVAPRDHCPV